MKTDDLWSGVAWAASCAGVPLEDRVAEETFYFDGRTVATLARPGVRMSAHHVLHEVCHFVVATGAERLLPEYGMIRRSPHISEGDPALHKAYGSRVSEGTISRAERQTREAAAQLVNRSLGEELGVPSVFGWGWGQAITVISGVSPGWRERGQSWLDERGVLLHGLLDLPRMAA